MECTFCLCRIGITYDVVAECVRCNNTFTKVGTYLGIDDYEHVFRLHPKTKCPKCGTDHRYVHAPCRESVGFDVTDEYRNLVKGKAK